jgi:hypothetical protein
MLPGKDPAVYNYLADQLLLMDDLLILSFLLKDFDLLHQLFKFSLATSCRRISGIGCLIIYDQPWFIKLPE